MNNLISYFNDIKARNKFIVYDTHVHPLEVIGACDKKCINKEAYIAGGPSLLERLDFRPLALTLLGILFRWAPGYIKKNICHNFTTNNYDNLIREMDMAGVDFSVVVPVEPFVSVDEFTPYLKSSRFVPIGSIDIQSIDIDNIEKELLRQKREYKIQGIKLHPNIQKFYPIPSHNGTVIAEKLVKLYEAVNKLKLYVLFHSGVSYLPHAGGFEKVSYAILENFFDKNGNLFDLISVPVVLAHLGSYNVKVPNNHLLNKIFQQYDHVYLDTAGVSSGFISKILSDTTCDKIIFGSDAKYFDIKYSIYRILKSLQSRQGGISEELVVKIFSQNYLNMLKRLK